MPLTTVRWVAARRPARGVEDTWELYPVDGGLPEVLSRNAPAGWILRRPAETETTIPDMGVESSPLRALFATIASREDRIALRMLQENPALAVESLENGASRRRQLDYFLEDIGHYVYAGDTALHVAAAAYSADLARNLVTLGACPRAKNRRGAQPLHYAADGLPGSAWWNPEAQARVLCILVEAGADPNATDKSGVAPLHRAVRTRCAAATKMLLDSGADPELRNGRGSTPLDLARRTTGRGGVGTAQAKAQQAEIVETLLQRGAGQGELGES